MSQKFIYQIDNFRLEISEHTCHSLAELLDGDIKVHEHNLMEFHKAFAQKSKKGKITKAGFLESVNTIRMNHVLSRNFTVLLAGLFDAFEESNTGLADVVELCCGFGILCQGSKSEKLACAFDLLDEDKDGRLTRQQLWIFFRNFLCTLYCISGSSGGVTKDMIKNQLDLVSIRMVSALCQGSQQNGVSFDDISAWYSTDGYEMAPWLELLDIRKWIPLKHIVNDVDYDDEETVSDGTDESTDEVDTEATSTGDFDAADDDEDTDTDPIVFYVDFSPFLKKGVVTSSNALGGSNCSLLLYESDAEYVKDIYHSAGLYAVDPSLFIQAMGYFAEHREYESEDGSDDESSNGTTCLTYSNFVEFLKGLLPLSREAAHSPKPANSLLTDETLTDCFCELFALYIIGDTEDEEDELICDFKSVAVGMSVLCGGSKSAKLALGFALFDEDKDGYLTVGELSDFLESYLQALVSFSSSSTLLQEDSEGNTAVWVHAVVVSTVESIVAFYYKAVANSHREEESILIGFHLFGQWYNDGGYERLSWIELIDVEKWIPTTPATSYKSYPPVPAPAPTSDPDTPPVPIAPSSPDVKAKNNNDVIQTRSPGGTIRSYVYQPESGDDKHHNKYDHYGHNLLQPSDRPVTRGNKLEQYRHDEDTDDQSSAKSIDLVKELDEDANDSEAFFILLRCRHRKNCSLSVSCTIAANVCRFSARMGFSLISPASAGSMFLAAAESTASGLLSKAVFDSIIMQLHAGFPLYEEEQDDYAVIIDSLFYAFERSYEYEAIDALELACGFSILCSGSKSVKLAYAFDLFDASKDGMLSRRGLWRFFRSFLCVLWTLSAASTSTASSYPPHHPHTNEDVLLDSAALWLCDQVFAYGRSVSGNAWTGGITFDHLADWYTLGGFKSASWLELLDMSKWSKLAHHHSNASGKN